MLIYLLDFDRFRVSLDGGVSWIFDAELTKGMSGGGKLSLTSKPNGPLSGVVRDMLFVRTERFTRFAFGSAGILYTLDGIQWQTLLNAVALGGCPESGFFDGITDPLDRTLYAEFEGRSILRFRSSRSTDVVATRFLAARSRRDPRGSVVARLHTRDLADRVQRNIEHSGKLHSANDRRDRFRYWHKADIPEPPINVRFRG